MKRIGSLLLGLLVCQSVAFAQAPMDRVFLPALGDPTSTKADEPAKSPQAQLGAPEVPGNSQFSTLPPAPVSPLAVYSGKSGTTVGLPLDAQSLTPAGSGTPLLLVGPSNSARPNRSSLFWGSAEYASWWVQGSRLPPLVTTSTVSTNAGVLGMPGTAVLYGDERVNGEMRPGGRFALGAWFDDGHTWGVEADLMFAGGHYSHFSASSDGSQIIARPFADVAFGGAESSELVAYPGFLNGSVTVRSSSDPLIVADAVLRRSLWAYGAWRVDFLIGYRYLHFAEGLQIQENLASVDPLAFGYRFRINDNFATRNDFNAGLLGLDTEWRWGSLSLQMFGKLGLGNLRREVDINGSTVTTAPGAAPMVYAGGLLALPSNSGTFSSDRFVVMPELGLTGGWQITRNLRATVGYSVLWLSDMVRPGDQIDRTVNSNQLPPPGPAAGAVRPIFTLRESDFWVQGIRLGLEFRY